MIFVVAVRLVLKTKGDYPAIKINHTVTPVYV